MKNTTLKMMKNNTFFHSSLEGSLLINLTIAEKEKIIRLSNASNNKPKNVSDIILLLFLNLIYIRT